MPNLFTKKDTTIITVTDKQRVLENRLQYFWNGQYMRYDVGQDVEQYINTYHAGKYSVETKKNKDTTVRTEEWKTETDWQEMVKELALKKVEERKQNK